MRSSSFFVRAAHVFLLRHRWLVTMLFCALLAVAAGTALHSRTDMTTLSFFPDTDAELMGMAEALHMAPFSRLLMVNFSLKEENQEGGETSGGKQEDLILAAQKVLQALPSALAVHATAVPDIDPAKLLPLVPALMDAQALQYAQEQMQANVLQGHMQKAKAELGQLWGSFALSWLQQDPLHLRNILFSRLPSAQTLSRGMGAGSGHVDAHTGFILSEDGKHLLLVLRPQFSMHEVERSAQLVHVLDTALSKHVPPHIEVLTTGAHRHSAANASTIEADIQRILLWSLAGFAAVYMLFVRSWTGALWLLVTPMVAGTLAWGAVASVWPLIAGLALGFGASILGIAEDYAMHMHFALRHGAGRRESSESVLDALCTPLVQAFMLNATGFGVLLFSAIPALRQLAAFALFTLAGGLLFALCILPLWTSFARPAISPIPQGQMQPSSQQKPTLRTMHNRAALAAVLTLLLLCGGLWHAVRVNVSPQSMGAHVEQIREDMQRMQSIWGENSVGDASPHASSNYSTGQIASPAQEIYVVQGGSREEALTHSQALVQALAKQGKQGQSLASLWPSEQEMQANIQRWKNFVQEHTTLYAQVQAAGLEQGFTKDSFAPMQAWLERTPQSIDQTLLAQSGLENVVHAFLGQGKNAQGQERYFSLVLVEGESFFSAVSEGDEEFARLLSVTHAVALTAQGLEKKLLEVLHAEQYLFPLTGLVCVLLLLCFSPRKKDILLATLPPLVALNGIIGVFLWQDMAFTLASMAALPLVLGLAIDHGIVMTHELGAGQEYGVERAIVTSSCTAILGMGLLMLAEHPALHSMGQVIVAGFVVEMPVALWGIPLFYKRGNSE